jgi:hypothetical protein
MEAPMAAHVERLAPRPRAVPAQRAGITLNAKGEQGVLGHIPAQLIERYGNDPEIGPLIAEKISLDDDAGQYFHNVAEDHREAVAQRVDPASILPHPSVRLTNADRHERQTETVAAKTEKADVDLIAERTFSHPFDYSKQTVVDFMRNQELRQVYARMAVEQRREVEASASYAAAILQTEPAASGVSPVEYSLMKQRWLRTKFPEQVARMEAKGIVIEALKQSVSTVRAAIAHERQALGVVPKLPPAVPGAARVWK